MTTATFYQWVQALYHKFVAALKDGKTYTYLEPFLTPLLAAEDETHIINSCIRNVAGDGIYLIECMCFEAFLCATILAIEELQMRFLEGGLEEVKTWFVNRWLHFQKHEPLAV